MYSQEFLQHLSPALFRDVDPASVDAARHKRFVICGGGTGKKFTLEDDCRSLPGPAGAPV